MGTQSIWQGENVKVNTLTIGGTQITASAAEINAAADVSARLVSLTDTTAYTVLAANSGKVHAIPGLTDNLTLTLPAAAAGLEYTFVYSGVAADDKNWVIDATSNDNFFLGGVVHLDTDAASAGDEVVPVAGNGSSNSKLTVAVPDVGTEIRLICDGTNWILSGRAVSATAPTFADQS